MLDLLHRLLQTKVPMPSSGTNARWLGRKCTFDDVCAQHHDFITISSRFHHYFALFAQPSRPLNGSMQCIFRGNNFFRNLQTQDS